MVVTGDTAVNKKDQNPSSHGTCILEEKIEEQRSEIFSIFDCDKIKGGKKKAAKNDRKCQRLRKDSTLGGSEILS